MSNHDTWFAVIKVPSGSGRVASRAAPRTTSLTPQARSKAPHQPRIRRVRPLAVSSPIDAARPAAPTRSPMTTVRRAARIGQAVRTAAPRRGRQPRPQAADGTYADNS
jgi:hypothetical protein